MGFDKGFNDDIMALDQDDEYDFIAMQVAMHTS